MKWSVDVHGKGTWYTSVTYTDIEANDEAEAMKIAKKEFYEQLYGGELDPDIEVDILQTFGEEI